MDNGISLKHKFTQSHSYIKTYQKDLTEDMIDLILNIAINIE